MVRLKNLAPSLKRRFQRLFGPHVELIWVSTAELDCVAGELDWIEDVLFDMVLRARAAMPFGGRVVIEWANIHLDHTTGASQGLQSGRYVMLEMTCLRQDPSELHAIAPNSSLSRLSDPWPHCDFAQARAMISSLGGQVCEYNEPGKALTIRAFFASAHENEGIQDYPVNDVVNTCRILLVEDESYVRDVACEILQSEGYDVLTAGTAKEALQVITENGPVHLLLTDVVMPGMNGRDLAAKLKSLHPDLKTIFMSGYSEGVGFHQLSYDPMSPFIQKPFTLESLTTMVKHVLNQAPAS